MREGQLFRRQRYGKFLGLWVCLTPRLWLWNFIFQYRDQNQAAREIIKARNNLTENEKIYIFEVELKTSEVEMNIEMESYPWSEMLRLVTF